MHKDILIISKKLIDESLFSGLDYLVLENPEFNSRFNVLLNNETVTYDYLITDKNYEILNLLTEDKQIITNQFFETSVDNIFAYKQIKSEISENEILNTIVNFLKNPY